MTHDLRTDSTNAAPQSITPSNLDAPVRIDVAMPRGVYDRLTDHDEAPRSRYDMATGRAEFVAAPGVSHEWRAWKLSVLFGRIEQMLEDSGRPAEFLVAGASRLLSDDGAFEPDTCVFFDPARARAAMRVDGYLDTRKDAPVPDLVVEIDRSVDSSDKLAPSFRMGVREAWTWSRTDGVRIWVAGTGSDRSFAQDGRSHALPGLGRRDLDRLLASRRPRDASRRARDITRQVVHAMLGADHREPIDQR